MDEETRQKLGEAAKAVGIVCDDLAECVERVSRDLTRLSMLISHAAAVLHDDAGGSALRALE